MYQKKNVNYLLSALILLMISCIKSGDDKVIEASNSGWQTVYQHDEDGQLISGSKEKLIQGIRKGYDVRVGWGWKRTFTDPERIAQIGDSVLILEHMAEPIFLSIIQEEHVSAIINAHPLLTSYYKPEEQTFREGGHIWQCVLTTQGTFNAKVYHRVNGELINDWPQTHQMTWFLEYP